LDEILGKPESKENNTPKLSLKVRDKYLTEKHTGGLLITHHNKSSCLNRQLLFLYVFCFEEVTTELQIPIRPIMRMYRLRCLVRGSGVIWRIYVFFYHEGNHLNIQKMIEPTQCSLKNVI
jgi:hypothetical protein